MKPLFLTLALLAGALSSFAQKFTIKKDRVLVDGQPYFRFESDGYDLLYIYSLQDERLLVVKEMLLNDPALCVPDNPTGGRWYLQFTFPEPRTLVETARPLTLAKLPLIVARKMYAAHVLQNGTVNPAAVADFASINGTVYSDRRVAINQSGWAPSVLPLPVTSPPQNPRTPRP